jgi:enamine deaminase RidA (YjgF/YER057c/UK114 family)
LLPQEEFPYYRLPAKLQMAWVLDNVTAICEAAGTSLDQICRRKVFHDDLAFFASSMEEWAGRFPAEPPASTAVELGGPALVPGAHFSLDLIAYVPGED